MCLLEAAEAKPLDDPRSGRWRCSAVVGVRSWRRSQGPGCGSRVALAPADARQQRGSATGRAVEDRGRGQGHDSPPALCSELALYLDSSKFKRPTDYVFPTSTGERTWATASASGLFAKAIERTNPVLVEKGIDPLDDVRPHGLRRTCTSLRLVCGDDPVYVSEQIGHTDVRFTLNVYAQSVKRRERMTEAEKEGVRPGGRVGLMGLPGQSNGHQCPFRTCRACFDEVADHEKSPA